MAMMVHQQHVPDRAWMHIPGMQHHRRAGDVAGMELIARKRRFGQFQQRQDQLAAFFFFRRR
jgi:hypothetical protein